MTSGTGQHWRDPPLPGYPIDRTDVELRVGVQPGAEPVDVGDCTDLNTCATNANTVHMTLV